MRNSILSEIIPHLHANGAACVVTLSGVSVMIAILQNIMSTSRTAKKLTRRIKYFLGCTYSNIKLNATVTTRSIIDIGNSPLSDYLRNAFNAHGVTLEGESVTISRDKCGRTFVTITSFYTIALTFEESDALETVENSNPLHWLKISAATSLSSSLTSALGPVRDCRGYFALQR